MITTSRVTAFSTHRASGQTGTQAEGHLAGVYLVVQAWQAARYD